VHGNVSETDHVFHGLSQFGFEPVGAHQQGKDIA
jgi:hypothetical protein